MAASSTPVSRPGPGDARGDQVDGDQRRHAEQLIEDDQQAPPERDVQPGAEHRAGERSGHDARRGGHTGQRGAAGAGQNEPPDVMNIAELVRDSETVKTKPG
jgi:hypothetical protein